MPLQERFLSFYRALDVESIAHLGEIYHAQVRFSDPVAVHRGLSALDAYFRKLLSGCSRCDFAIRQHSFGTDLAWVNWTMTFNSPRINGGRAVEVDGSSVLTIAGDRITSQRDYYDLGAMVYEHLPLLGGLIRHIRGRMAP